MVTPWLNQPFTSAPRPAAAVTTGGVASYLRPNEVAPALPALSKQVPATEARELSGPAYVCAAEHDATPEKPSLPSKETVTCPSYQPFASGARPGVAVTEGPFASYLSANGLAGLRLPALSRQVPVTVAAPLSGPL